MEWKERLREDLNRLANDHVGRLDPERGYDRRVTPAEQRVRRALRHHYFIPNRRDCWAYVQAAAFQNKVSTPGNTVNSLRMDIPKEHLEPYERLRPGEKYFASFLDAPVQKIVQEALRAAGRN